MTSSTSPSKAASRDWSQLAWIIWVVGAVICIEMTISVLFPSVENARRNFLEYRFNHQENPDRLITTDKLDLFGSDDPVVLQVGDSSGFHGVQPPIVEERIGARYLNMSVFAGLGYEGYYQMANYMFERNAHIRYLVLYITAAGQQPRPFNVDANNLGEDIRREYRSPLHALFRLPSLALRPRVTDLAYYGSYDPARTGWLRQPTRYMEAPGLMRQTGGWTREEDNGPLSCAPIRASTDCSDVREDLIGWARRNFHIQDASDDEIVKELAKDFGISPDVFDATKLRSVNMADRIYDRFKALAEAYGARLIISAAPISEIFETGEAGEKIAFFTRKLHEYAKANPTVSVINPVFWPEERFSSPVHVSTPYISANSRRVAEALADIVVLDGKASQHALAAGRLSSRELAMGQEHPPAYGFGPALKVADTIYRGIREGRDEAIVFHRAPAQASQVQIQVAPDTPPDLLKSMSLATGGELMERLPSDRPHVLRWRLSPAAMRYGGWLEMLISTRGRSSWPRDALDDNARGPSLKIAAFSFD